MFSAAPTSIARPPARLWLVLLLAAGASQWACPAYLLSAVGPTTGHEELQSRPLEEGAVLTCDGAFCDSFKVQREFDQKRKPGVFLALLGAEAVGSAILIANSARIARDDKAGRVSPDNDSRYGWNKNAAILACTATVFDGIFGLIGWGGDSFDRIFKDERLDKRAQVKWRGTRSRVELPDLKSADGNDVLARFSVQKVFDINGLKSGQAEPFEVKKDMKMVALPFTVGDVKRSEDDRRQLRLLLFRTVRGAAGASKPALLDLMSEETVNLLLVGQNLVDKVCAGELCNLETARAAQADLLITGVIAPVGDKLKLTLQLEQTKDGKILSSAQALGASDAELDTEARRAAAELMEVLK